MKSYLRILCTALVLSFNASICTGSGKADYRTVPLPEHIIVSETENPFILTPSTVISYPEASRQLKRNAELLAGYVRELTGIMPDITAERPDSDVIVLSDDLSDDLSDKNGEAYEITVTESAIEIKGASASGNFRGLQTLRKSIDASRQGTVTFPAATIKDKPRFGYRGAHFDTARHFFPVDSVKRFIDMLALHGINNFHWHLTDDQGWRLEIEKYPRLTETGAWRKSSALRGGNPADPSPYGGFYSREDAIEIVKYAADRHITVIPEIDLPGHMLAALASYPEFGCTGGPYEVWCRGGVSDDVLCAGNDDALRFVDDVLDEVCRIFPSEYIHIGGDECPDTRWESCPKCHARIKELGLTDEPGRSAERKLQTFVMTHAAERLASHGRKIIGWDEMIDGGLPAGSTVMSWRSCDGAIQAAAKGHDAILTPATICYFSGSQTDGTENEPLISGGYLPISRVYAFDPTAGVHPDSLHHIIGLQSCIWTEGIDSLWKVMYQELPRIAALSEVQWSQPQTRDYRDFARRLTRLLEHYRALGYPHGTHIFDISGHLISDPATRAVRLDLESVDNAPIRYTTDGSEPTDESPLYTAGTKLPESCVINARIFRPTGTSRLFTDTITVNKATFRNVTLENPPHKSYGGPATLLTDGCYGHRGYNTGRWLGFEGCPVVATIDLETPSEISSVKFRNYLSTSNWIFDTREIKVEVSADGTDFIEVYREEVPRLDGHKSAIRPHTAKFTPAAARFVRLTLRHENSIPQWHKAGKGQQAFLFVDEIEIN